MQPKENVNHMAMPGRPGAMLIMIHSHLTFSFFTALLDGPPHDGGFAHLRERHIDRGIGERKFGFPVRSASDKKPDRVLLGQAISSRIDPKASHLSDNRSLGAFGEDDRFPVTLTRARNGGYGDGLGLMG